MDEMIFIREILKFLFAATVACNILKESLMVILIDLILTYWQSCDTFTAATST